MPFVHTIRERSGSWFDRPPVSSIYDTRNAAEAELVDYIRRNWKSGVGAGELDDEQEPISEHFDDVLETYTITEA